MTEQPSEVFLPYGRQSIDDDDIEAVTEVLRSDWLTTGPAVPAYEEAFASAVEAPYAISCSSGTAALHLMMAALEIGPSDAVIVPAVTFAATANGVRYVGAKVIFADVDPETALMGAEQIAEVLDRTSGPPPRAVIPVHMAGQPAAMEEISGLANRHGIAVVEDACHAVGSRYATADGAYVAVGACLHSIMAAFSTHPVKTIATGEGGAVTCRDEHLAQRLACLRNHGIVRDPAQFRNNDLALDSRGNPNPWYYEMHEPGFNYRASDIHCALGRSQLRKLGRFIDHRRRLVLRYDTRLTRLAPHVRPLGRRADTAPAWHLYTVLVDFAGLDFDRAEVMARLRERGIGTQVHYVPVPWLPLYRNDGEGTSFPGAAAYYNRTLSLPLFPAMRDSDVDRVVDALSDILGLSN